MKIEFDSNFNKFEYQEKKIYIQKLLNDYPLNVVVTNLIYNTDDVFLCFKLMNEISKTNHFKSKNKIKTISLASLLINTLVVQNKNQDLYNYLNCIDKNTLKKIILYETNNKTIFSKTKICKSLYNEYNINKTNNKKVSNKKTINYDDLKKEKTKKKSKAKEILKKEIKSKKAKLGIGTVIFIVVMGVSYILVGFMYTIIFFYNSHIYPNTYLDNKLIEGKSYEEVYSYLKEIDNNLDKKINFIDTNGIYSYSYKEIGILVNTDNIKSELKKYSKLNGFQKLYEIFLKGDTKLEVNYSFDESKYNNFKEKLKRECETEPTTEKFSIVNGNINYIKGKNGFKLDISNLDNLITESIENNTNEIKLSGDVIETTNKLDVINKKVSTFTTSYYEYQRRSLNIRKAVSRLNGTIVYPNEIFSFYNAVGPYNSKNGYVFYGEYVGSGVCQVSTTIYNNQLLLNLPIVSRLNHGAMVPYVDYGLDATVYSNTTDYRFKNNTKYPIHIEAIADDGNLTISFWSNENIIEKGYSYKPRSVKIGYLAYKTYLDTYYEGKLIKSTYLNSSYYYKGK